MFCINCEKELSNGSNFCANCGAKAEIGEIILLKITRLLIAKATMISVGMLLYSI